MLIRHDMKSTETLSLVNKIWPDNWLTNVINNYVLLFYQQ